MQQVVEAMEEETSIHNSNNNPDTANTTATNTNEAESPGNAGNGRMAGTQEGPSTSVRDVLVDSDEDGYFPTGTEADEDLFYEEEEEDDDSDSDSDDDLL